MKINQLVLSTVLGLSALVAKADHTVGTGGDALRDLFEHARGEAASQVYRLQWCSFDSSVDSKVSGWILANQARFANDILRAAHLWAVDSQATCGYTAHTPEAPIYLSYPTCASTVGTSEHNAMFTILHETAHHLGADDERLADQIASAILGAQQVKTCPTEMEVFNPEICQGPIFSSDDAKTYLPPGGPASVKLENYNLYARTRQCTVLSGCGEWVSDRAVSFGKNNKYDLLGKASVVIQSNNSSPYYIVSAHVTNAGDTQLLYSNSIGGFNILGGTTEILSQDITNGPFRNYSNSTIFNIGTIRKNCAWVKGAIATQPNASGQWTHSEIVMYGTHSKSLARF